MSRHGLATALGLSSVVPLGRIERGEKNPDDDLIGAMATVLDFPAGFFYAHDLPEIGVTS